MLQRVQTIYMLAGILWTLSAALLVPVMVVNGKPVTFQGDPVIAITLGVTVVLHIIAVALYRNRMLQLAVNRINTLYNLLLFGAGAYMAYYHLPQIRGNIAHFDWGALIPVWNVVLLYLANRGIMADEQRIRSLDRLR